jgi:hypothetical protein
MIVSGIPIENNKRHADELASVALAMVEVGPVHLPVHIWISPLCSGYKTHGRQAHAVQLPTATAWWHPQWRRGNGRDWYKRAAFLSVRRYGMLV